MVVIAAIDRGDQTDGIVREADTLATATDEPLRILHVMNERQFRELERKSVEESQQTIDMDEIRDRAAEVAARAGEALETDAEAVGLVGDPAEEVVEYADKQDARYIVIGGRRRSPVGKALFGSAAQSILLNTDRPVLVVKRPPSTES